jgi:hypothetical protein
LMALDLSTDPDPPAIRLQRADGVGCEEEFAK